MAIIKPFKGIRYNAKMVKFEDVVTEPFDMITPDMQQRYYDRSTYNLVRVILGKDTENPDQNTDKYKQARTCLNEWLYLNVLISDKRECFYFYRQDFNYHEQKKSRIGLIARVKLEEFSSKIIVPHEKTFPEFIDERLALLQETKMNTEQIFLLYEDPERQIAEASQKALSSAKCIFSFTDEYAIDHSLYMVHDSFWIDTISVLMEDKILIIADGHHRYATSLHYKNQQEQKEPEDDPACDYIMATMFRINDPGLVILPTYRLIKGLDTFNENDLISIWEKYFNVEIMQASLKPTQNEINTIDKILAEGHEKHIFACYCSEFNKFYLLKLKENSQWKKAMPSKSSPLWKNLDVAILHSLIFEYLSPLTTDGFSVQKNVRYIRNLYDGITKVINKKYQAIFLMNPPGISQVIDLAYKGELMPERSTDFYPKLKSGMVLYPLEEK